MAHSLAVGVDGERALGRIANVPMPACEGLANVAGALLGRDFWNEGRNAKNLGIEGLDVAGVKKLVIG